MATMNYGTIPGVNKPVARLIQGTTMISPGNAEESFKLLDAVYAHGGNTFDTAKVYSSEGVLGEWIRTRGVRDDVVIITKGGHQEHGVRRVTPNDITDDIHTSLKRLQVDHIDLYILHRDDTNVPVGPLVEVLNTHAAAGRIGAFGGSNWTHNRIREANTYAAEHGLTAFTITSPQFSLAEQYEEPWENCVTISGSLGEEARRYYADANIAVFVWSSLAGGFFSGNFTRGNYKQMEGYWAELCSRCYCGETNFQRLDRVKDLARTKNATIPQIALSYIYHSSFDAYTLTGCSNGEEFRMNLEAFNVKLTQQEMDWLDLRSEMPF